MKYILEESSRFPKPAHAHLSLATLNKRIDEKLSDGACKGGSCYDCDNLSCQRDLDAATYKMNKWLERIAEKARKGI